MGHGSRSRRSCEEALASGADAAKKRSHEPEVDIPSAAAQHAAHKARQRRRRNERRHAAVADVLSRLQPPAGVEAAFTPLEEVPAWRRGEPAPIDWASVGAACDPGSMANDGDEAAMRGMSGGDREGGGREVGGRDGEEDAAAVQTTAATATPNASISLRAMRKRWQVESFAVVLRELEMERNTSGSGGDDDDDGAEERHRWRLRTVDFGAGSGNLTLPLAKRFPRIHFTAVEMKQRSADLLMRRAAAAGLRNVDARVGMIERCDVGDFDVGVALHACGNATDHAIARCVAVDAAFVVSPCCIGKLKFSLAGGSSFSATLSDWTAHPSAADAAAAAAGDAAGGGGGPGADVLPCPPVITHPRSRWLASQLTGPGDFAALAAAADTGHAAGDAATAGAVNHLGRRAKAQVELDRAQAAREAGYAVATLAVVRADSAPPNKAEMIVGVPGTRAGVLAGLRLPATVQAK